MQVSQESVAVLLVLACAGCGSLLATAPEHPPASKVDSCATAHAYGYAGNVTAERNTSGCEGAQYGPGAP